MTFKANWEKTSEAVELPRRTIEGMIASAFPSSQLSSCELLAGGCANLNYKIQLKGSTLPSILRIYLRDHEAGKREQALANLIGSKVPIPNVEFVGTFEEHAFAISECCPGITLRDLLLEEGFDVGRQVLTDVGKMLTSIHSFSFSKSAFLDGDLRISSPITRSLYLSHGHESIAHPNCQTLLGKRAVKELAELLERRSSLLPTGEEHSLVHGDFGPENLLVVQRGGEWKLSAILDWEFAFSGSGLTDVANMLRYANQLPAIFEESFLRGVKEGGVELPEGWREQIDLMNILALLDCLNRHPLEKFPNRCSDIKQLVKQLTKQLYTARG